MPSTSERPADWPDRLPPEFYAALEQINHGAYFECHETLEALWIPETRSVREIYQGVLQIAVGCYHLTARANWVGAVNKLEAGVRRLERAGLGSADAESRVGEEPYGVDWTRFVADAHRLQAHLRSLGRERVREFDPALLPQVTYRLPQDTPSRGV
jgi:hypothetical protein